MQARLPFFERIWHVKSAIEIGAPMSSAEAFERLNPLFQTEGTEFEVDGETLTFSKHNPAAQDKLATFTRGKMSVVQAPNGTQLFYELSSPALLMVFLAPLLFLAFGQAADALSGLHEPSSATAREAAAESEDEDKEYELHWLDQALGAPTPEKPSEEDEEVDKPMHSSTPAYVLAAIFAAIFMAGRILEPWLVKRTFRKALARETEVTTKDT